MSTTTPFEALKRCLTKAGSQPRLAKALGCSQPAVWKMLQSAKRISHQYVLTAEKQFGVSRHELRPDIYPPPIRVDRRKSESYPQSSDNVVGLPL
jgi:DNA-binding transcriptional regulator YdaS (Cro superfamily)